MRTALLRAARRLAICRLKMARLGASVEELDEVLSWANDAWHQYSRDPRMVAQRAAESALAECMPPGVRPPRVLDVLWVEDGAGQHRFEVLVAQNLGLSQGIWEGVKSSATKISGGLRIEIRSIEHAGRGGAPRRGAQ